MTLRDIPTNLVTGRRGSGKSTVIRHLLSQRPAGERWAVLVNDVDAGTLPAPATGQGAADDGAQFSLVADGCICCSAQDGVPLAVEG